MAAKNLKKTSDKKAEEATQRASDRIRLMSNTPEIWDQLSDLINYYDERKDDHSAKAMIRIIEDAMAMSFGDREYIDQFTTLYKIAIESSKRIFREKRIRERNRFIEPSDVAHDAILNLLQRPAEYNPVDPRKIGYVKRSVKFQLLSTLESERTERLAKDWLATFLKKKLWKIDDYNDPEQAFGDLDAGSDLESDSSALEKFQSYFKEMLRKDNERREEEKQQRAKFKKRPREIERDESGAIILNQITYSPAFKPRPASKSKKIVRKFVNDIYSGKISYPVPLQVALETYDITEGELFLFFVEIVHGLKKREATKIRKKTKDVGKVVTILMPKISRDENGEVVFTPSEYHIQIRKADTLSENP